MKIFQTHVVLRPIPLGLLTLTFIFFLPACGGGGSSGNSSSNASGACSRFARAETSYYHPLSGITNSSSFTVGTRESNGSWITGIYEYDDNNDGTVDTKTQYTYLTHNNNGYLLTYKSEFDNFNNGTIDETTLYTYTRDSNGNRLTRLRETDSDNNGTVDRTALDYYIEDSDGHSFRSATEYDDDNDGTIDRVYTVSYSYVNGIFSSSIGSYDADNDGTTDDIDKTTYTFSYNSNGSPAVYTEESDLDNNGTIDRILTETSYYESFDCGSARSIAFHNASILAPGDYSNENSPHQ